MRDGTERFQAAQNQGRPQSCNRYPHASTSSYTPLIRNADIPGMFKFVPLLGISDIKPARTATSHL